VNEAQTIAGTIVALVKGIVDEATREQVTALVIEQLRPSPPAKVTTDYLSERARVLGDADEL
jgi:hypothetical protein